MLVNKHFSHVTFYASDIESGLIRFLNISKYNKVAKNYTPGKKFYCSPGKKFYRLY